MSNVVTVHAIITGRVQGVWYRAWTKKEADKLGLNGWVRNRNDGSVEAVFSGTKENVDKIISVCHSGPTLARVDDIVITSQDEQVAEAGFHTLPNA